LGKIRMAENELLDDETGEQITINGIPFRIVINKDFPPDEIAVVTDKQCVTANLITGEMKVFKKNP